MTMKVINSIPDMRAWRKENQNKTITLVPTMGYLHEGHLSLIRIARQRAELVIVTIFVNPAQFSAGEDLDVYPRDLKRDLELCSAEGVDLVFNPSNSEMYLKDHKTYVVTDDLSSLLCGVSRPAHFQGVATIVAKLFNIVQPNWAVFGQKDAQQAIIINRMVEDLNFSLQLIIAPIVREEDGLAMSSRNKYLSPSQRNEAVVLQKSLQMADNEFKNANFDFEQIKKSMESLILNNSSTRIDYIEFRDAKSLEPAHAGTKTILVALAAYFGQTRLIDNIILSK